MDLSNPNFYKNKILPAGDVRLYFAQIFPNISKLLYLDVDTIVRNDISPLFETDLTDMAVAMVQEKKPWTVKGVYIGRYCNSGVCLFNLDYIREHKLDEQMIELINGPRLNMPDQDIINYVCRNHIVFLDPKYNCSKHTDLDVNSPVIRHYTYNDKLWDHKNSIEWNLYYVERLTNE